MVSGLRVARLGEVGKRPDADQLGHVVLGHAPCDFGFENGVLIAHPVARLFGFELGAQPRQHDKRLDRLSDEIGGTKLQASLFVAGFGQGGEEDYRDVGGGGVAAQTLKHGITCLLYTSLQVRTRE